jgi:hypothetical protein
VVANLVAAVDGLWGLDLDSLSAREVLALTRDVEVVRRRLDAANSRVVGHLERTGAHGADGHRSAKAAVKYLGRLPGCEAFAQLRRARALRMLPAVADAYAAGAIPVASMAAIASVAANPRIGALFDATTDAIIAEQASQEPYDAFVVWLREWERLADADGADPDRAHGGRNARLVQDPDDLSWSLTARTGSLQGAVLAEVFAAFEAAEWETDRQAAIAEHGPDVTVERFCRTPAQRRADALLAIFRRAATAPADAASAEPLINVIVDAETLHTEAAIAAGDPDACHQPLRPGRVCRITTGHPLHPGDTLAALLVGAVRRVVIDSAGTVIDLGRRRRCFTGSARDAALLQAAVADRGGTSCLWAGCDNPRHQIDHRQPWR